MKTVIQLCIITLLFISKLQGQSDTILLDSIQYWKINSSDSILEATDFYSYDELYRISAKEINKGRPDKKNYQYVGNTNIEDTVIIFEYTEGKWNPYIRYYYTKPYSNIDRMHGIILEQYDIAAGWIPAIRNTPVNVTNTGFGVLYETYDLATHQWQADSTLIDYRDSFGRSVCLNLGSSMKRFYHYDKASTDYLPIYDTTYRLQTDGTLTPLQARHRTYDNLDRITSRTHFEYNDSLGFVLSNKSLFRYYNSSDELVSYRSYYAKNGIMELNYLDTFIYNVDGLLVEQYSVERGKITNGFLYEYENGLNTIAKQYNGNEKEIRLVTEKRYNDHDLIAFEWKRPTSGTAYEYVEYFYSESIPTAAENPITTNLNISIFPNPTIDQIYLSATKGLVKSYQWVDVNGKVLKTAPLGDHEIRLPENFQSQFLFLKLLDVNNRILSIQKVMVSD